jgi:hypothetical protein
MPSRVGPYSAPSCVGQGQIIGLRRIVQSLHGTRQGLRTGPCVAPARISFKTLEPKCARSPSSVLHARVIGTAIWRVAPDSLVSKEKFSEKVPPGCIPGGSGDVPIHDYCTGARNARACWSVFSAIMCGTGENYRIDAYCTGAPCDETEPADRAM